ncbi:MAG TPA: glucosaminidase domain-containing protein [Candidatus Dormibacteraeota bacterium]|nr:glucosaminidase domain-containing protein [Candidatus Dormibacteraeota bacterium]
MDGAKKWGQTAVAAVVAGAGALALIAGTSAPLATASSNSSSNSPTTLAALVAKAKLEVVNLGAEVQTARAAIANDKTQIGQERRQLANLLSAEYTGAPNGLLSVLASPDFNSALDTQIALAQLTESQRQLLVKLAQDVRNEQASEAALQVEQKEEAGTEARLQAEELVAEFQATQASEAASQPKGQAGTESNSAPGSASASSTPKPATTPTPPAPTGTPTPSVPPATGGPFTVNTNLTLPSGITLGQIQEFLQGTPLEADAGYFVQAEQTDHVSAIYLVSDAILETGYGTSQLYLEKHNLFGFGAYDADPFADGQSFSSDQDCISFVSWFVSVYYLNPPGSQVPSYGGQPGTVPTGQFYNGATPAGMNVDYASDPLWAQKIAQIGVLLQSA